MSAPSKSCRRNSGSNSKGERQLQNSKGAARDDKASLLGLYPAEIFISTVPRLARDKTTTGSFSRARTISCCTKVWWSDRNFQVHIYLLTSPSRVPILTLPYLGGTQYLVGKIVPKAHPLPNPLILALGTSHPPSRPSATPAILFLQIHPALVSPFLHLLASSFFQP